MTSTSAPAAPHQARQGHRLVTTLISAILSAFLLLGATVWVQAGAASAHFIGNGHYIRGVGSENSHGFWLGALETAHNLGQDEPSFCVTMWQGSPDAAQHAQARIITAASRQAPEHLALTAPEMAFILQRHYANGGADSRAALAYLAHLNFEGDTPGFDTSASLEKLRQAVRQQFPVVEELAAQYADEARAFTPREYRPGTLNSAGFRGTLEGVGAASRQGWTSEIPLTVTLQGPAVFTATGNETWNGTTTDQPLTLEWEATGNGPITATATFSNIPRSTLTLAVVGFGVQDLITLAARPDEDRRVVDVSTPPADVALRFAPKARTNVGEARLVDPPTTPTDNTSSAAADKDHSPEQQVVATISDTVTVYLDDERSQWPTLGGQGAPVTFHGRAYRIAQPYAAGLGAIPQDATLIGETSLTVTGTGTYQAKIEGVEPGFVTWVWEMRQDDPAHAYQVDDGRLMSEVIAENWADAYGIPEETSSVRTRLNVDTALSPRETRSGTYLVDDLYISGFPADHGQFTGDAGFEADHPTLTHTLYFFPAALAVSEENLEAAQVVGQVEIPARNGFVASVGANEFAVRPDQAGTYVFVTYFPGDARVAPYRTPVTDTYEHFTLPPNPSPDTPQSSPPAPQPPQPDLSQSQGEEPPPPPVKQPDTPESHPHSEAPPATGKNTPPGGMHASPLPTPLATTGTMGGATMILGAMIAAVGGLGALRLKQRSLSR